MANYIVYEALTAAQKAIIKKAGNVGTNTFLEAYRTSTLAEDNGNYQVYSGTYLTESDTYLPNVTINAEQTLEISSQDYTDPETFGVTTFTVKDVDFTNNGTVLIKNYNPDHMTKNQSGAQHTDTPVVFKHQGVTGTEGSEASAIFTNNSSLAVINATFEAAATFINNGTAEIKTQSITDTDGNPIDYGVPYANFTAKDGMFTNSANGEFSVRKGATFKIGEKIGKTFVVGTASNLGTININGSTAVAILSGGGNVYLANGFAGDVSGDNKFTTNYTVTMAKGAKLAGSTLSVSKGNLTLNAGSLKFNEVTVASGKYLIISGASNTIDFGKVTGVVSVAANASLKDSNVGKGTLYFNKNTAILGTNTLDGLSISGSSNDPTSADYRKLTIGSAETTADGLAKTPTSLTANKIQVGAANKFGNVDIHNASIVVTTLNSANEENEINVDGKSSLKINDLTGTIKLGDGSEISGSSVKGDNGIVLIDTHKETVDDTLKAFGNVVTFTAASEEIKGNDFASLVNAGTASVASDLIVGTLTNVVTPKDVDAGFPNAVTGTVNVLAGGSLTATSITNAGKIDVKAKAAGFNAGDITNTGALTFGKLAADSEGNVGTVVAGSISNEETTAIGSVSFSSSKATVGDIKNQKTVTFTAADVAANEISGNTTVTVGKGISTLTLGKLDNTVNMANGAVLNDSVVTEVGENAELYVGSYVASKTNTDDGSVVSTYAGNVVAFTGGDILYVGLNVDGGTVNVSGTAIVDDVEVAQATITGTTVATDKKTYGKQVLAGMINVASEVEDDALIAGDITNAGIINVGTGTGTASKAGSLIADSITNSGTVSVSAISELAVTTVTNSKTFTLNGEAVIDNFENAAAGSVTVSGKLEAGTVTNSKTFSFTSTTKVSEIDSFTNNVGATTTVTTKTKGGLEIGTLTNNGTFNANGIMSADVITNGTAAIPPVDEEDPGTPAIDAQFTVKGALTAGTINNYGTFTVYSDDNGATDATISVDNINNYADGKLNLAGVLGDLGEEDDPETPEDESRAEKQLTITNNGGTVNLAKATTAENVKFVGGDLTIGKQFHFNKLALSDVNLATSGKLYANEGATITIDAKTSLSANSFVGDCTITFDAEGIGDITGPKTLVSVDAGNLDNVTLMYNGEKVTYDNPIEIEGTSYTLVKNANNIKLSSGTHASIYVDDAWKALNDGDEIEGFVDVDGNTVTLTYGFNAFSKFSSALKAASGTIYLVSDIAENFATAPVIYFKNDVTVQLYNQEVPHSIVWTVNDGAAPEDVAGFGPGTSLSDGGAYFVKDKKDEFVPTFTFEDGVTFQVGAKGRVTYIGYDPHNEINAVFNGDIVDTSIYVARYATLNVTGTITAIAHDLDNPDKKYTGGYFYTRKHSQVTIDGSGILAPVAVGDEPAPEPAPQVSVKDGYIYGGTTTVLDSFVNFNSLRVINRNAAPEIVTDPVTEEEGDINQPAETTVFIAKDSTVTAGSFSGAPLTNEYPGDMRDVVISLVNSDMTVTNNVDNYAGLYVGVAVTPVVIEGKSTVAIDTAATNTGSTLTAKNLNNYGEVKAKDSTITVSGKVENKAAITSLGLPITPSTSAQSVTVKFFVMDGETRVDKWTTTGSGKKGITVLIPESELPAGTYSVELTYSGTTTVLEEPVEIAYTDSSISLDASTLQAASLTNDGVISAENGAVIANVAGGEFANNGVFELDDSTLTVTEAWFINKGEFSAENGSDITGSIRNNGGLFVLADSTIGADAAMTFSNWAGVALIDSSVASFSSLSNDDSFTVTGESSLSVANTFTGTVELVSATLTDSEIVAGGHLNIAANVPNDEAEPEANEVTFAGGNVIAADIDNAGALSFSGTNTVAKVNNAEGATIDVGGTLNGVKFDENHGKITATNATINAALLKNYGTYEQDGGTFNLTGTVWSVGGTITLKGDANFNANINNSAKVEATSSTITGNITNNATGDFKATSSTIKGNITNNSTKFTANGGSITGDISNVADATFTMEKGAKFYGAYKPEGATATSEYTITNDGTFNLENAKITGFNSTRTKGATIDNTNGTFIVSGIDFEVSAKSITTASGDVKKFKVSGTGKLDVVTLSGRIRIDDNTTLNSANIDNGAAGELYVASGKTLTLKADSTFKNTLITNAGTIKAEKALSTKLDNNNIGALDNKNNATVNVNGDMTVGTVTNDGTINASANVTTNAFTNKDGKTFKATGSGKTVTVNGDLSNSGTFDVTGNLATNGNAITNVKNNMTVGGTLKTTKQNAPAGNVTITAGSITATGAMEVGDVANNGGTLTAKAGLKAGAVTNGDGKTIAVTGALNTSGKITNSGSLTADSVATNSKDIENVKNTFTVKGALNTTKSGAASGNVTVTSGKIDVINNGAATIGALTVGEAVQNGGSGTFNAASLNSGDVMVNRGTVSIAGAATVGTLGIGAARSGTFKAASLKSNAITVTKGTVSVAGAMTTSDKITNSGEITAGSVTTKGKDIENKAGATFEVTGDLTTKPDNGNTYGAVTNNGTFTVDGNVTTGAFTSDGGNFTIKAKADKSVTMTVNGNFSNTGTLTIDVTAISGIAVGEQVQVVSVTGDVLTSVGNIALDGTDKLSFKKIIQTTGDKKGIYLYKTDEVVSAPTIYVNGAWNTKSAGDQIEFPEGSQTPLTFGLDAFAGTNTLDLASDTTTLNIVYSGGYDALNITQSLDVAIWNSTGTSPAAQSQVFAGLSVSGNKTVANFCGQKIMTTGATIIGAGNTLDLSSSPALDRDPSTLSTGAIAELKDVSGTGTIKTDWNSELTFVGACGTDFKLDVDVTGYNGGGKTFATGYSTEENYRLIVKDNAKFDKYFVVEGSALKMNAQARETIYVSSSSAYDIANAIDYTWGPNNEYHADNIVILGGNYAEVLSLKGIGGQTITVEAGNFTKSVYGGNVEEGTGTGRLNKSVTGDINIEVNGGSFKNLVAGDNIKTKAIYSRTGNINLSISGTASFTSVVAAGMMCQLDAGGSLIELVGNTNLTISGGSFAKTVFGGMFATKLNSSGNTYLDGTANVTVVGGDDKITFGDGLCVGSYGYGGISKGTALTLTGNAEMITFTGTGTDIWGGCSGDYYTTEGKYESSMDTGAKRTLTFSGFEGNFAGCDSINGFSDVFVKDATDVVLSKGINLKHVDNWTFECGSTLAGAFTNDLTKDTLTLKDYTNLKASKTWTLFGADVDLQGVNAQMNVYFGETKVAYDTTAQGWVSGEYTLKYTEDDGLFLKNTAVLA